MTSCLRKIALVLLLALPLSVQQAAAQDLYDAGLALAAATIDRGVAVLIVVANDAPLCDFSEELLKAEAERTLRRDGISPRTGSSTFLTINVVMVPILSEGCAAYVGTNLMININAETDAVLLAATAGQLLTRVAPDHVGRIREVVEQQVSVIANAIRRAEDELPDR